VMLLLQLLPPQPQLSKQACNATLAFRSANLFYVRLKRGYALNIRRNLKRAAVGGGDEPQRHDERQG
jgi:hypothetical protein